MKVCALGEQTMIDTFELIGVQGRTMPADSSLEDCIDLIVREEHAGVVLVESQLLETLSETEQNELTRRLGCLIVAIPGMAEPMPDPARFLRHVRAAIGGTA